MRMIDTLLQRFLRWYRPLTPEQEAEEDFRVWQCKWKRYMMIRRQHEADGYVDHPGYLEDAWGDLRLSGDEGGFLYDPRAWKYRELARGPLSESDPVLGPMMKASNARRALILADIDFLIEDTTAAPPPDEDPAPRKGRSASDATFGNYLSRRGSP